MWQQTEMLEHHRYLVAAYCQQCIVVGRGDIDIADAHRAGSGLDEAGEAAHQRRLPAARQAHHHEHLAGRHIEVDIAHGDDIARTRFEFGTRQIGIG